MKFKNTNEFIAAVKRSNYPFYIWDELWDGGCPCSDGGIQISNRLIYIETRCWRVSIFADFQDLRILAPTGTFLALGSDWISEIIKSLNRTEWYNPYRLIYLEREAR